jgi:transposase
MLKKAKISWYEIKKIISCFCIDVDATKTSLLLELNRNTINRYFHLFRQAIYLHQMERCKQFMGEIEVDESYFGAKRVRGIHGKLKRGRGTMKQPVFGIFKRKGQVYTEIIPDCKKRTLQRIIRGRVSLESIIHTDGWRGYDGLVDVGYGKHLRVNHSLNEFTKGPGVHINGIENFWSFTKRRLSKFNGVKTHFALHLKECEWRYSKTSFTLEKELAIILKNYLKSQNLLV